jgi:hypothetical protein
MVGEQLAGLVWVDHLDPVFGRPAVGAGAGGLASGAHEEGEQGFHLEEGSRVIPQKEEGGPTPHLLLELAFDKR